MKGSNDMYAFGINNIKILFFSNTFQVVTMFVAGMRVREASMGLLYRKMLRLRSLKDKKIGEVSVLFKSSLSEIIYSFYYVLLIVLSFITCICYNRDKIAMWMF